MPSILGFATLPASGDVWFEPASITQTNDRYAGLICRFKDTATKISLGVRFYVPAGFVGRITIIWTTTATSGNAVWNFDYTAIGNGETLDPNSDQESLNVTTAAPGTSQLRVNSVMNMTLANLAAGDLVEGIISRNGAGSDTIAADLCVYDIIFE